MNSTIKDKTVLITGAAFGIGRAAALAFGREGARVAVVVGSLGGHVSCIYAWPLAVAVRGGEG